MFAPAVHLSLTRIADPARHRAHNAWRQLDLHPELLLQPGIAWGEAWVRSPDCVAIDASGMDGTLGEFDYAQLYWLRAPEERSAREFVDFHERAFQIGRRPDVAWASEPLREFLVPLKGYVNPRVLVSADALPFRPMTGIHLKLSRFIRHDAAADAAFRWYDQVRIPDLLECTGAAGAWTFATRDLFKPTRDLAASALRVQIVYLDGDPLEFADEASDREAQWRNAGRHLDTSAVEQSLFAGPLRAIVPWRWDWFDQPASG